MNNMILDKANELLEEVTKLNDPVLKKRVNDLIVGIELGSQFKRIDITFLEMTAEGRKPRFAVMTYDRYVDNSGTCQFNTGRYEENGVILFQIKSDIFEPLSAYPKKTVPETIRAVVDDARSKFDSLYIAWEAEWNVVSKDPIIFGEKRGLYYIIATFDLSEFESYVVDKFGEK